MSTPQRGLGRGLDALFGDASPGVTAQPSPTVPSSALPLDKIIPNPDQPRRSFSKETLEELAASIRSQGIIQPLLVRPKPEGGLYEIVAGERRWRAAKIAGLKSVPVFIRELSDEEVMLAALIENLQREDLNPMEEALALQSLRDHCQCTQEELAAKLGKSRPAVANTLRLLQLSLAAQDNLRQGVINAGHARALLSITDNPSQEELRRAIIDRRLTVRDAEEAAAAWKSGAPFPWAVGEDAADQQHVVQRSPKSRAKSQALKDLQKRLGEHLEVKASVSGSEDKGRITLSYANAEELSRICQSLGVEFS